MGMLSQTYLEDIKAQAIIVPIVPFSQTTNILHQRDGGPSDISANRGVFCSKLARLWYNYGKTSRGRLRWRRFNNLSFFIIGH